MSEETWYSVELGDILTAIPKNTQIHDAYFYYCLTLKDIGYIAIFTETNSRTNIETAYFTPSARALAEKFNATPCAKPSGDNLQLTCGDFRCWQAFFPERIQKAIQRRRTIND